MLSIGKKKVALIDFPLCFIEAERLRQVFCLQYICSRLREGVIDYFGKLCKKASGIILQLSGLVCDSIEIWDAPAN